MRRLPAKCAQFSKNMQMLWCANPGSDGQSVERSSNALSSEFNGWDSKIVDEISRLEVMKENANG